MSNSKYYSTLDEVEFLRMLAIGQSNVSSDHFAFSATPQEKIEKYIATIEQRHNWDKIEKIIIELVCGFLLGRTIDKEPIVSATKLVRKARRMLNSHRNVYLKQ